MEREGVSYRVLSPDNIHEKYGQETFHILAVDAALLKKFASAFRMSEKNRAAALTRLMKPDRPKIILINPDLLYLFYSLRYRMAAEIIAHFQAYRTVIFDEFHLYAGVELAHILFLIHTAQALKAFQRVVLLTATPPLQVRNFLDLVLDQPLEITGKVAIEDIPDKNPVNANPDENTLNMDIEPTHRSAVNTKIDDLPVVGSRTIAHNIQFAPKLLRPDDLVAQLADELDGLKEAIKAARQQNPDESFVPIVVIVNSVIQAIRLEDELADRGWSREHLGIIRGLSCRTSRSLGGKLIILGTSAIEVGIDFKTDLLIFQAGDSASFMQRFGRLGRHGPGKAILLASAREYEAFSSLAGSSLSRDEFEAKIAILYGERDAMAWFVRSQSGALTMSAQAEHIRSVVMEDRNLNEKTREDLDVWIDTLVKNFASKLSLEKEFRSALSQFRRIAKLPWLQAYTAVAGFRTSVPNVEVFDWAEKARGREPVYEADASTLLKWAEHSPRFKKETGTLYINGYAKGSPHQVWVDGFVPDNPMIGAWFSTGEATYKDLRLIQDGHLTSVSHLMVIRPHLFTIIPFEMTKGLDWRLQTFRIGAKGQYAIAFDGTALIVKEMLGQ